MKLADSLRDLARHLRAIHVDFAVIGGLAASARGEARFTRDIDIAVSVEGDTRAEEILFELGQRGHRVIATVEQELVGRLATARSIDARGVVCDLVFATCGVEREVVALAQEIELFPGADLPTASVEALLAMKTLSAVPARPRDLGDIQAMVRANPEFDENVVHGLLMTIEARGYARGQVLMKKWEELKRQLQLGE